MPRDICQPKHQLSLTVRIVDTKIYQLKQPSWDLFPPQYEWHPTEKPVCVYAAGDRSQMR